MQKLYREDSWKCYRYYLLDSLVQGSEAEFSAYLGYNFFSSDNRNVCQLFIFVLKETLYKL
jgi:hypothetical protein